MEEAVTTLITQWGIVGILVAAAGYIIWDNYKKNKEREKYFQEKVLASDSRDNINSSLNDIKKQVDHISVEQEVLKKDVFERIENIENHIKEYHPDRGTEAGRLEAITLLAPTIHTLMRTSIDDMNADHILVALLHNGTKSICGTPFLKFDVIAEKFFPIRNPQDAEMAPLYHDADIMIHNQLPACIIQNQIVVFDVEDKRLESIDGTLYRRLINRGVKEIAFGCFRDIYGTPNGILCAYSFDKPLNVDVFKDMLEQISTIYIDLMK